MDISEFAGVILISGAAGFGTYCACCAWHVWKRRNAHNIPPAHAVPPAARLIKRVSQFLVVAGLAGMALGLVLQSVLDREGVLEGRNLFTVRPARELHVAAATTAESVQAGDPLVRYDSPERQAETEILKLKRDKLQTQKEILQNEPLTPDAEITRQLQNINSDRRHLRTRLGELEMELGRVRRERSQTSSRTSDELNELQTKQQELENELSQAESELDQLENEFQRSRNLLARETITQQQHEEAAAEYHTAKTEAHKLRDKIESISHRRNELRGSLEQVMTTADRQVEQYRTMIDRVRTQLAQTEEESDRLQADLADDLDRARRLRDRKLAQIDVELDEVAAELNGLTESLAVTAPFDGQIIYRHSSPQTAEGDAPLVVLAPQDAVRLVARLPKREQPFLSRGEAVRLELVEREDENGRVEQKFVDRRFSGRLVESRDLPHDPDSVLAEFVCAPSPEAVRLLAAGEQVQARLVSWPPLLSLPPFLGGTVLLGLGAVGWIGAGFRAKAVGRTGDRAHGPRATEMGADYGEYGAEGALLQLAGTQLREMIVRGTLDRDVIASAEWILDRHKARGVRLLRRGLGEETELAEHLENLVDELTISRNGDPGHPEAGPLLRLMDVLRIIGPDHVQVDLDRLRKQVQQSADNIGREIVDRENTPVGALPHGQG